MWLRNFSSLTFWAGSWRACWEKGWEPGKRAEMPLGCLSLWVQEEWWLTAAQGPTPCFSLSQALKNKRRMYLGKNYSLQNCNFWLRNKIRKSKLHLLETWVSKKQMTVFLRGRGHLVSGRALERLSRGVPHPRLQFSIIKHSQWAITQHWEYRAPKYQHLLRNLEA